VRPELIEQLGFGHKNKTNKTNTGGLEMNMFRRLALASLAAVALVTGPAQAADTIRIGLPTKSYWPTTIAETAVRQRLFDKEGLRAELTIYRSGAESFEAMAAGAVDMTLDPPSLVSNGRRKGVLSRIVAKASMGNYGWQLMVPAKSDLDLKALNGRRIGITAAGSSSDLLAQWTGQDAKIEFARTPVGGNGLVSNLLGGKVDAAVVYSPLSLQLTKSGEARAVLDYAKAVPPNLTQGWIVLDRFADTRGKLVQKALNALYGAVDFMRANRDVTVKLIAELYEVPPEIAALEYDTTIMKLETNGSMAGPQIRDAVQLSLDLARVGSPRDVVPAEDIISAKFEPVPTKL
jgi:ABC-type nitrate/sulfonate/bicarbonate transport system substrate-binding protein